MENEIRARLEELKLKPDQIDELMPLLVDRNEAPLEGVSSSVDELRALLALETDYRKKASLAARIISVSLEEGKYY